MLVDRPMNNIVVNHVAIGVELAIVVVNHSEL